METTEITTAKETIQEKRNRLKILSAQAKEIRELAGEEEKTINDIIIETFYKNKTHQEFKSFKGWIKDGFVVKKGETAFLVWGRPKQEDKNGEVKPVIENDDSENGTFYPVSFIFSNAQVQPLKNTDNG
tara:strand:- start:342 stop:728 length:387 start_codon:yes stop_codon:yes gene_type:complete